MSTTLRRTIIAAVVIAAIAAAAWYWSRPKPVAVILKQVERGRVESTVANTRAGTVNACRRARLAPAIGGQIAKLPVREGNKVSAGQILLELWNDDLAAQLKLAERDADASRARADESCVSAEVAHREANRLTTLRARGLASEEDAERAVGNAKARAAACRAARASTQVNDARIDVAKAALERTLLLAPFDGTVAEVNGELGEFVTPSPIGVPTLPAVDLIDNSCLYVTAPIDEVDAPAIRAAMPARITLDAFPERRFAGSVRRVAPYVLEREKQARTVDIEVDFTDPQQLESLLPGYSADTEVVLATRDKVLRIPTEAILEGHRVLVYGSDGILSERRIEVGISNWKFTEVNSGLEAGEQIVVSVDREGVSAGAAVVPEQEGRNTGAKP